MLPSYVENPPIDTVERAWAIASKEFIPAIKYVKKHKTERVKYILHKA